ncbi:MAG: helix-turn-helix domain-containing protein, partial [Verrucomicrobiales bacterium]|nr:helix-turn-helix domain-containing protein [Verrucomicrobiales bacterium]
MSDRLSLRLTWVREYLAGHCTGAAAATRCQLSLSQFRRCLRRFREAGAVGLQHRLRDRPSNHRAAPGLRERALTLCREHFFDCGPTLAAELLAERHQLVVQ